MGGREYLCYNIKHVFNSFNVANAPRKKQNQNSISRRKKITKEITN
jgi:hypothetical protein